MPELYFGLRSSGGASYIAAHRAGLLTSTQAGQSKPAQLQINAHLVFLVTHKARPTAAAASDAI